MKQLYVIGGIVLVLIALLFVFSRVPSGAPQQEESGEPYGSSTIDINNSTTNDETASMDEAATGATRRATLKTNKGDIVLELFTEKMPITTGNFIKLAQEDFYDNTKFHRVIEGFMIQGGDPLTKDDSKQAMWGTGGSDQNIEDEFVAGLSNVRGTISMANTGAPNSGGSQWFINLVDNTNLDFDKPPMTSRHPVFGRVVEGMEVVDAIGATETGAADRPVEAVVITDIVVQ